MKNYTLDGNKITSLETLYDEIAQVFEFPAYFGRNLDAFAECLGDLTHHSGPVTVILKNCDQLDTFIPEWHSILEVLRNNNIAIVL